MTATLSWYTMDNKAGVNLQQTETPGSISTALPLLTGAQDYAVPAARANLGDHVQGNNNSLWLFVKASSTVTAGNAVVWDEAFNANNATTTLGVSTKGVGIAQFYTTGLGPGSIQSTLQQGNAQPGDFFWIATQGQGLVVNITATASANAPLFLTTTPGQLSTTVATARVAGLFTGTAPSNFAGSNTTEDVVAYIEMNVQST